MCVAFSSSVHRPFIHTVVARPARPMLLEVQRQGRTRSKVGGTLMKAVGLHHWLSEHREGPADEECAALRCRAVRMISLALTAGRPQRCQRSQIHQEEIIVLPQARGSPTGCRSSYTMAAQSAPAGWQGRWPIERDCSEPALPSPENRTLTTLSCKITSVGASGGTTQVSGRSRAL
jgi:hypothetical protein